MRMNTPAGVRAYPSAVYLRYHPFKLEVAGWTWAGGTTPGTTVAFTLTSMWRDDKDPAGTTYDIDSFGTFTFTIGSYPTLTVASPSSDSVSLSFALPSHVALKANTGPV